MIRLMINHEAWTVLGGEARDGLASKCERAWRGGAHRPDDHVVWLEPSVVDQLKRHRAKGEGFSETILRLAKEEARQ